MQHLRRLGELDIRVFDHLDAIAPGVEKIEKPTRQQLAAGGFDPGPHARPIIDDEPTVSEIGGSGSTIQ